VATTANVAEFSVMNVVRSMAANTVFWNPCIRPHRLVMAGVAHEPVVGAVERVLGLRIVIKLPQPPVVRVVAQVAFAA